MLLLAVACANSRPTVRVYGTLRGIMHDDDRGAKVTLARLTPHAHGVGALADLDGEVTILDGEAWLATFAEDGHLLLERTRASQRGAALLVVAEVPVWRRVPVTADVAPAELDAWLERTLVAAGVDISVAVPVRLEGRFSQLAWHVVDGSKIPPDAGHAAHATSGPHGVLDEVGGTLVGFFSRHHGGVFTHMGEATHFHVVAPDNDVTGHVDSVGVRAGSALLFP